MQEITREELLELVNVEKNDGEWRVLNVLGDVDGRVCGNVGGGVLGSVCGNVGGDVWGDVEGSVCGNVGGDVWGDVEGSVEGDVLGDVEGDVEGKEPDTQNWKPESGKPAQSLVGKCEVLAVDDKRGKTAVRWTDGNLGVVNTHLLKPPMTEEDKAVEDMFRDAQLADCFNFTQGMARALYRAGYRKQPAGDMADPANWRAGDFIMSTGDYNDLTDGKLYKVIDMDEDDDPVIDDDAERTARPSFCFRFHSRP